MECLETRLAGEPTQAEVMGKALAIDQEFGGNMRFLQAKQ